MELEKVIAFVLACAIGLPIVWMRLSARFDIDGSESMVRADVNAGFVERVRHDNMQKVVRSVLDELTADERCPCHNDRFCYIAGKEHGVGWQDNIQNELVEQALELDLFDQRPKPDHSLDQELTCRRCGTEWRFQTEEWRMLAYHHRLVRQPPAGSPGRHRGIMSNDVFQTLDMGPAENARRLSLEEWRTFILGQESAAKA